ncbi:MAG: cytochrome c [Thiomicrorhabdus sp.]|nr:cytochrome c [Thiomicrorhabdus sp.]
MKSLFTLLSLGGIIGFLFIWFGLFNISAKDKHWDITTELLEVVKERSIEVRAENIQVPDLSNSEMISNGAKNFDAMCSQCHLAPGMEPTELNLGLYPQPPVFYNEKHEDHGAANTFWVIQNGLKMTGMPAWGDFHTEEQLWEMVAFMQVLNGMSESKYKELVGEGGHTHKEGFGHDSHAHDASNTPTHDSLDTMTPSHSNNDHGDHDH